MAAKATQQILNPQSSMSNVPCFTPVSPGRQSQSCGRHQQTSTTARSTRAFLARGGSSLSGRADQRPSRSTRYLSYPDDGERWPSVGALPETELEAVPEGRPRLAHPAGPGLVGLAPGMGKLEST